MIKIFICEDNVEERKRIKNIIKSALLMEQFNMKIFISTGDPYEIIEEVKSNPATGLYFLDVDLNAEINGIQLAEQIRKYDPRGFIVFITTHEEMSHLTFLYKVEALDYIYKDNFQTVPLKIQECMKNVDSKANHDPEPFEKTFSAKVSGNIITVKQADIIYFETSSTIHKVVLHTENRRLEFYDKMKNLEKVLGEPFFRCHNSFLINKNHLVEINTRERIAHMSNGDECLLSIRSLKKLSEEFYARKKQK